jgi:hypothetical protein
MHAFMAENLLLKLCCAVIIQISFKGFQKLLGRGGRVVLGVGEAMGWGQLPLQKKQAL